MKTIYWLHIFIITPILLTACGNTDSQDKAALPDVNDVNCMAENIQKISDKDVREQFAMLCKTRPSNAPTSPIQNTPGY